MCFGREKGIILIHLKYQKYYQGYATVRLNQNDVKHRHFDSTYLSKLAARAQTKNIQQDVGPKEREAQTIRYQK